MKNRPEKGTETEPTFDKKSFLFERVGFAEPLMFLRNWYDFDTLSVAQNNQKTSKKHIKKTIAENDAKK